MSDRVQLTIVVTFLLFLGLGLTFYKFFVLDFPLLPGKAAMLWVAEARISFETDGGDVEVSFAAPESNHSLVILDQFSASRGYQFSREVLDGQNRAIWKGKGKKGRQSIYYQVLAFEGRGERQSPDNRAPVGPTDPEFEEPKRTAAANLIAQFTTKGSSPASIATGLIRSLSAANPEGEVRLLLGIASDANSRSSLAVSLINMAGVPARIARGILLEDGRRSERLSDLIEIWTGHYWQDFQPDTAKPGLPDRYLLWQRGGESLLDLVGGTAASVTFSTQTDIRSARELAVLKGQKTQSPLIDFSIYALPINQQNVFKLLLLVPIGTLVVVLMRNVVGVRTSGTFMPILIALAFKQTHLVSGLIMFVVVVGIGLVIRAYLTRLNLLLVPRISAVVIIVVILFAGVSIVSSKLGLQAGLTVTFFPMIIMAWTIERMSVLWEESGAREALVQGAGSLAVAVLVYGVMSIRLIEHLTFSFPELLLVVLAVTLMLGHYTGYRLTELRRFRQLVTKE